MTKQTPSRAAKFITKLALILLILMPLSALGSRFGLWPYTIGLLLIALTLLGGLLIEIICAIWLLQKPHHATKSQLRKASLYALPPLLLIATLMRGHTGSTMLHDISTDTENPPTFIQAIKTRGEQSNSLHYTLAKSNAQHRLYPHIGSIKNPLNKEQNTIKALNTAQALNWDISYKELQKGHIEAVVTSLWFGFKDDIVIRASDSRVDIRSISRVGKSDLGANAKRIKLFIDTFTEND